MALAGREARAAERDALVERDVAADLRRLADDDADAVVDEEPVPDAGGRVDLDPRRRAAEGRERAGDERDAGPVQRMGDAVGEQGVDAGPQRQHLERPHAARGRVAVVDGVDVAANLAEDARHCPQAEHRRGL